MDEKFELKRIADSLEQIVTVLKEMTSECEGGTGRVLDIKVMDSSNIHGDRTS